LAQQVDVDEDRMSEQRVEISFRHVGAGEGDLTGFPSVFRGVANLSRRAGVDADALGRSRSAERTEIPEHRRLAERLEREPHPAGEPGAREGGLERTHVGADDTEVVDVQRRSVLPRKGFGVIPGDPQAAVHDLQAGARPPGARTRVSMRGNLSATQSTLRCRAHAVY
jgi:hypothetical protein